MPKQTGKISHCFDIVETGGPTLNLDHVPTDFLLSPTFYEVNESGEPPCVICLPALVGHLVSFSK